MYIARPDAKLGLSAMEASSAEFLSARPLRVASELIASPVISILRLAVVAEVQEVSVILRQYLRLPMDHPLATPLSWSSELVRERVPRPSVPSVLETRTTYRVSASSSVPAGAVKNVDRAVGDGSRIGQRDDLLGIAQVGKIVASPRDDANQGALGGIVGFDANADAGQLIASVDISRYKGLPGDNGIRGSSGDVLARVADQGLLRLRHCREQRDENERQPGGATAPDWSRQRVDTEVR